MPNRSAITAAAFAGALLLLLPGCGGKADKSPNAPQATGEAPSVADDAADEVEPSGAGGVTAIDAALGTSHAMPADSTAPSAYDRARVAAAGASAAPARQADAGARSDAASDAGGPEANGEAVPDGV